MMCHFEGPGTLYVQSHAPAPVGARGRARAQSGPVGRLFGVCVVCTIMCCFFAVLVGVVWGKTRAGGEWERHTAGGGRLHGGDFRN